MSTNVSHFGLGNVTSALALPTNKGALKSVVGLGLGSVGAIAGSDLLQSRVLLRNGSPIIPQNWAPAFTALFGIVGGGLAKRKGYGNFGTGMIAGGVGIGLSAIIARLMSPTVAASQAAADAAEQSGMGPQSMAGFGFGRAFARGLAGVGGLGRVSPSQSTLFGVGTPDMSAANMFNGATTAIEEPGLLSGASVSIEAPNFAASFS